MEDRKTTCDNDAPSDKSNPTATQTGEAVFSSAKGGMDSLLARTADNPVPMVRDDCGVGVVIHGPEPAAYALFEGGGA